MKNIFAVVGVAVVLVAIPSFSQSAGLSLTLSAASQFPAGDFEKTAGPAYGATGVLELGGDNLRLTAMSGYFKFLERGGVQTNLIPLMGGLVLSPGDRVVYLYGEGGPVLSGDQTNIGWGTGVGSVASPFDLRFSFHVWDTKHTSQSMSIGLSIGLTTWMP